MWQYRRVIDRLMLLKRSHLIEYTRTKQAQGSSMLLNCDSYNSVPEQSSHVSHWFVSTGPFDTSYSSELPALTIQKLKSFDEFGLLSSSNVSPTPGELTSSATPLVDHYMSCDNPSSINVSAIPTTVDPSELGGLIESGDMEQLEELLDQSIYHSPVFNGERISQLQNAEVSHHRSNTATVSYYRRPKLSESVSSLHDSRGINNIECSGSPSPSSPAQTDYVNRFDPDINRTCRSTAEEVITAMQSQDLSLLRSILTEKKWPDHRSIGTHLDDIFELIIRDSHDTDEAILFMRDFAACNLRGFLHDLNGIRLACRVVLDSGSLPAATEILRIFRNMFLVRSPDTTKLSTSEQILEEFYETCCTVGSKGEVEEVHKMMISHGFDKNSNTFIRVFTIHSLAKNDFVNVFDSWKRLSSRYGTTCASDLIWKEIFNSVSDRGKQVDLAGDLLAHCQQYDHPSAIIANLVVVLIRLNQVDAARSIFAKVSVPGRFFKRPLKCIARNEDALQVIENFALLVTQCMFAEKRRTGHSVMHAVSPSPFVSPEFLSKLDSFCGMGRSRHRKFNQGEKKLKLHRINDEQLFELSEFVQLLWVEKAEINNDAQAIDRLVSWSVNNRLEIPLRINKRIEKMRSTAHSRVALTD